MSSYQMPNVELGQTVLWFHAAQESSKPYPAVVIDVADDRVAVKLLNSNYQVMSGPELRGCRHMEDPDRKPQEMINGGGWRHTKWTERILDIERVVKKLIEIAQKKAA